jgi:hypothetical protein
MEKYYAKQEMKIDVRHMKWDEVFGHISQAADQYEIEGGIGPKGTVRRTLRGMKITSCQIKWSERLNWNRRSTRTENGVLLYALCSYYCVWFPAEIVSFTGISAHAPAMKQWLGLIPNDSYGSCIAGGFQMFATAAQRSYDMRKSVREAMIEIPKLLSRNRDYIELYKARPRDALTKAVADLFKSILVTLRLVVEYLTHSSAGRAFKSVLRGGDFEKELEESMYVKLQGGEY